MQTRLHNLPKITDDKKKRKGRGLSSGAGAKSGRGTTRHQGARTNIPLHFEGGQNRMVKKFPLLRGKTKNRSYNSNPYIVNIGKLNRFAANEVIDLTKLVETRMVAKGAYQVGLKILGKGKLEKALQVALPVSVNAREQIEKAGGKIIEA